MHAFRYFNRIRNISHLLSKSSANPDKSLECWTACLLLESSTIRLNELHNFSKYLISNPPTNSNKASKKKFSSFQETTFSFALFKDLSLTKHSNLRCALARSLFSLSRNSSHKFLFNIRVTLDVLFWLRGVIYVVSSCVHLNPLHLYGVTWKICRNRNSTVTDRTVFWVTRCTVWFC